MARALYRDAPLLICDEPTVALDARAEAAVYESLRRLAAGRTVVQAAAYRDDPTPRPAMS